MSALRTGVVVFLPFLFIACGSGPALPSYGVVPDFQLTDQAANPFESRDQLNGRIWVANFIFTNCMGPCPRMTSQLRQLREAVSSTDVRFVSFSVDPARDTPEALKKYSERFGPDPQRWSLLTGNQADLHNLARKGFLLGNVDGSLEHSTRFVLVDGKSRIRGYYDTSEPDSIKKLTEDMQKLLKDHA